MGLLDFLQVPSAKPAGPSGNGSVFPLSVASNILSGGVSGVATTVGGKLVSLVNKAAGHGARVVRKDQQTEEAKSLGLTYECIRVRDAALAAGVAFTGDSGGKSMDKVGGAACDTYAKQLAAAKMPTGAATINPSSSALIAGASGMAQPVIKPAPTMTMVDANGVSVPVMVSPSPATVGPVGGGYTAGSTVSQQSSLGGLSPMVIAVGAVISVLALILSSRGGK